MIHSDLSTTSSSDAGIDSSTRGLQATELKTGLTGWVQKQTARLLREPPMNGGAHIHPNLSGDSTVLGKIAAMAEGRFQTPFISDNWDGYLRQLSAFLARQRSLSSQNTAATSRPVPVDRPPVPHTSAFGQHVNPYLAEVLHDMGLDVTYTQGRGCILVDDQGREVLDGIAQYGALPFGYNPPRIWDALLSVRDRQEPAFAQPSILPAAGELAGRLLAHAPWMARCTFANSGSEAIEVAIKLSRSATGRDGILSASRGYHGKTLAALSATARPSYKKSFGPPLPGFDKVPFGDLLALEKALQTQQYAAFIVEPIQGEGGIVVAPEGYLRAAAALCRAHGTLLVVDEVQTGLGRTGAMFASVADGVEPDILVLAKALGGGLMPIGACLCRAEVHTQAFALTHSSTCAGNALACRVGLAVLDWLEEDEGALLSQVRDNGALLREGLQDLQAAYPHLIKEVRGEGFMLGLELGVDRHTWPQSLVGCTAEQGVLGLLVCGMLLHEGVRLAPAIHGANVLRIEPSLTMTTEECERLVSALKRVFARIASGDTARMLTHLIGEPSRPTVVSVQRSPRVTTSGSRFAFLLHPLSAKTITSMDPRLSVFSVAQRTDLQRRFHRQCEPFIFGEVHVKATTGETAHGTFITLPHTAAQLAKMPHAHALESVRRAVMLAQSVEPTVIGLGGFTSVVTRGGRALGPGLPPMTTGSTYTALCGEIAVAEAMVRQGLQGTDCTVALFGAGGAIGRRLQVLMASRARCLLLLGNPDRPDGLQRLRRTAESAIARARGVGEPSRPGTLLSRIQALLPTHSDAQVVRTLEKAGVLVLALDPTTAQQANIVISATSSPRAFLLPEVIGSPAILCDLSRPFNIDPAHFSNRTEIIEGGVVHFPGTPMLPIGREVPQGHGYACMAETTLIALSQQTQLCDVGRRLSRADFESVRRLAGTLGFTPQNTLSVGV